MPNPRRRRHDPATASEALAAVAEAHRQVLIAEGYLDLARRARADAAARAWTAGATGREIARAADVSPMTASRLVRAHQHRQEPG